MPSQNKILVSHESPLCLLEESRNYNDFDYALVHLFDTHPKYLQFFKDSLSIYDRDVLLDNSLFELGAAFDKRKYMDRITELKPTLFVMPDVFQKAEETCLDYENFISEYGKTITDLGAFKIGVVHGKTWQDLLYCYQFMSNNADVIALSFDFEYYQITGEGRTHHQRAITGRQRLISQLISRGIWDWDKPHHLLGCSLPQEFSYYRHHNVYNIRSVDTSNPIIHGINNIKYSGSLGLMDKVKVKMADLIDADISVDQKETIYYNIEQFQNILNGY